MEKNNNFRVWLRRRFIALFVIFLIIFAGIVWNMHQETNRIRVLYVNELANGGLFDASDRRKLVNGCIEGKDGLCKAVLAVDEKYKNDKYYKIYNNSLKRFHKVFDDDYIQLKLYSHRDQHKNKYMGEWGYIKKYGLIDYFGF